MNRLHVALAILAIGLVALLVTDSRGEVMGLDNDRFAALVYGSALLVVVGSGLIMSRRSFGPVLRNLAVWLLLVLLLVAGYQYRYELQDVASRVTAGLVPGSPMSSIGTDGRATVMLDKRSNGHFGVRAIVDGSPVDFIVDTGASTTVLTIEDARAVGIDVDRLAFSVPVSTANGVARAAAVPIASLAVGTIERRNLTVLVTPPGALDVSLLGMNFIASLSGFDMRGDRLILRD